MPTNPTPSLDLLSLAEDVAEGRRSLDNVIDQIAVATPDDRERRRAVAELQSLVVALAGVRSHARATAAVAAAPQERAPARGLVVDPRRVVARPSRLGRGGALAAGLSAVAAVIVIAVVVASLRPASGPATGGPSATAAPPSGVVTPSSAAPSSAVGPGSPAPSPAATFNGPTREPLQPPAATSITSFWRISTSTTLTISGWANPALALDVPVKEAFFGFDTYRVLVSPTGARVAVAERHSDIDGRVRVFDAQGTVLWTGSTGQADALDLAWSADGHDLAFGVQPSNWTILSFDAGPTVIRRDYTVGVDRLIAFSGDNRELVGYETTGEAQFWQKPVSLSLATGSVAPIAAFPPGLSRASTGPVAQIDPLTGDVLIRTGGAKGPAGWAVRHNGTDQAVDVVPDSSVVWTDDGRIVASTALAFPQTPVTAGIYLADAHGSVRREVAVLPAGHTADVVGVMDGVALVMTFPSPALSYPHDPGHSDAALVNLSTGEETFLFTLPTSPLFAGIEFAGWIFAASEAPTLPPTPASTPVPPATPGPTVQPTPVVPATPGPTGQPTSPPTATATPFDVDHPTVPGAPIVALWSGGPSATQITIWRWNAAVDNPAERWLTLDAWPTRGTLSDVRTVVVSPDGDRLAFLESDASGAQIVQRLRVFDAQGRVLWTSPDTSAPIVDIAWSPDGTRLALGSVPSPWTILIFTPTGQIDSGSYELDGPRAYRLLGFTPDNAQLIGYESSGEAAFSDRPMSFVLRDGGVIATPIDRFPAAMASNTSPRTGPAGRLDNINSVTGDALTVTGPGSNAADWIIVHGSDRTAIGVSAPTSDAMWITADTIIEAGAWSFPYVQITPPPGSTPRPTPAGGPGGILWARPPDYRPVGQLGMPTVTHSDGSRPELSVGLMAAHDGYVVFGTGSTDCCTPGATAPAFTTVGMINVVTRDYAGAGLPQGTKLAFAGWVIRP